MMSFKLIAFNSFLVALLAASSYAQGSNTYLPPKQNGYNYPPPPTGRVTQPPGVRPPPSTLRPPNGEPPADHVHEPGMPFDFQYAVNDAPTQNDYSHKANSDGDVTRGEYRVQLPDGRTQVVRYTADWKTGYHADVSYEGTPQYPTGPAARPGGLSGGGGGGGYRY